MAPATGCTWWEMRTGVGLGCGMGDGVIGEAKIGLAVEDLGEGGRTKDGTEDRTGFISVAYVYQDSEGIKIWDYIFIYGPAQGPQMWGSRTFLGPNQQTRTSPPILGKTCLFMDLGHPVWSLGTPGT
ncbi:hypothetical protein O181_032447 [Austropuccinia psidii MF-1]|uniref:Uncharacterized protein n=1 Tax=Austropuccinia psidii MF-1 TaxID=1389203 RepID=A0A9Q3H693_9BASI|nr:hypothetical protein [Austropuccinia psidii MF-1]